MTDFVRRTVEEFAPTAARPGGVLARAPRWSSSTTLAPDQGSSTSRPSAYSALDGDSIAIAASNGGSAKHPAWYHNLKANPAITVELGTQRFEATAEGGHPAPPAPTSGASSSPSSRSTAQVRKPDRPP